MAVFWAGGATVEVGLAALMAASVGADLEAGESRRREGDEEEGEEGKRGRREATLRRSDVVEGRRGLASPAWLV